MPTITSLRNTVNQDFDQLKKIAYNNTAIRADNLSVYPFISRHKVTVTKITTDISKDLSQLTGGIAQDYLINVKGSSIPIPLSKTRLSHVRLSLNHRGFDIALLDEVRKKPFYRELLGLSQQQVLDVGAGWGEISLSLLKNNNQIFCNEIEASQLLAIYDQAYNTHPKYLNRLYLSNYVFPDQFKNITSNTFDSIILHRVIAILTPKQANMAIREAYRIVKPGGRVYIASLSDQHHLVQTNIVKHPKKILSNNNGMLEFMAKEGLPLQAYTLPKSVIAISEDDFLDYLKETGFQIKHIEHPGTTQKTAVPEERSLRTGRENIAIIAEKPHKK
ncbi:methyltransferase domain-containing protein [Endozoicomonas sp. Mp262]|uniref:class I SAM-dependent methyltransferase n=1 Tax=Endozoicomonas sp. Mp262 TaxID=2919499 RepID=UPI0021DA08ED